MIQAGDFRKGVTIEYEGNIYTIVDFQHVKPGKGAAFVRTRLKNVVTGAVLEKTFNPTEKVENALIETQKMQYSYNDGDLYYFMDEEYNMIPLNYEQVEDALKFIKENDYVMVKSHKGVAFSVECENFVELLVTEAEPSVAGNTATNATKIVKLETGISIQVPMFVNEGDVIRIDTRTGDYMERVKK
ncbi:MAG: elongation factor P [Clostridiales bacterium]|nr:elongation factor P [Clostridiales bacterium]